jgi:hypothetical protein
MNAPTQSGQLQAGVLNGANNNQVTLSMPGVSFVVKRLALVIPTNPTANILGVVPSIVIAPDGTNARAYVEGEGASQVDQFNGLSISNPPNTITGLQFDTQFEIYVGGTAWLTQENKSVEACTSALGAYAVAAAGGDDFILPGFINCKGMFWRRRSIFFSNLGGAAGNVTIEVYNVNSDAAPWRASVAVCGLSAAGQVSPEFRTTDSIHLVVDAGVHYSWWGFFYPIL